MSSGKTKTISTSSSTDNTSEDTCVVCFKNCTIYSIGECDHPVCYECSTRMRVLCQQNECPICRQVLSKVIFTYDKLPYRELEAKNRSDCYSRRYKIGFYDAKIQQAFFDLMDHPCSNCEAAPYRTFQGLKNHVRNKHNLHYCDICTENLKIFTFERRCYTKAELGLHLTKGDEDNRSHRGHPLCEYCNKRYLDRDELFRHLRREHYFCHFCDADGCNEFYRDYDALAEHFRQDHFLCEEGKCATEQFVGAFRTDIDYKAHIASVHGKMLNKQQAKQTRTLQLDITLGPRGRTNQNEQGVTSMRSRGGGEEAHDDSYELTTPQSTYQSQRLSINIDASNEQDFPSLSGAASGPNVSLIRAPPLSMRNRSAVSGLARTKENFPALGGGGGGTSVIRKGPTAATGAIARTPTINSANSNANAAGMVIHVSNRPHQNHAENNAAGKKSTTMDFPALPSTKLNKKQVRNLEEDLLPPTSYVPVANVAAKHRVLVDDYVSVANPSNFQKIQMVQKEEMEAKARKAADNANAPKLTTEDFPTLSGLGGNAKAATSASTWVKVSEKKQRELENRKSKVAPPPLLPKDNNVMTNKSSANNSNNNSVGQASTKKDKKKEKKVATDVTSQANRTNGKSKEKNNSNNNNNNNNNNNENKLKNANTSRDAFVSPPSTTASSTTSLLNGNDNSNSSSSQTLRPPPGFSQSNSIKPPPGFHSNVTVNSVAKSPNNLTFTNSLGDSYSIVPTTHTYIPPSESLARNQKLVSHFNEALKTPEALEEFRRISENFLSGVYKTQPYYEHCQAALKDKFDKVFPELIVMLPDISKQQALYLVHSQRLNSLASSERNLLPKLEVCSTCKQVLLKQDLEYHRKLHEHKENFPKLNACPAKAKGGNANRK